MKGAEGQVFQHAMFGMLRTFSAVLMAMYMKQQVSRWQFVDICQGCVNIGKHVRQTRENSKNRRQLIAIIFYAV